MSLSVHVGRRIEAVRRAQRMSRYRLAQLAGVQQKDVVRVERGRHDVQLSTVARFCAALEVDPAVLVGGYRAPSPHSRSLCEPQPDGDAAAD